MESSLLIIGAGPSGLLAAWTAAQRGDPSGILVVDHLPKAGVKLAVTGGGRGNLSHLATEEEFAGAFGKSGRFAVPAFRSLPPEGLRILLAKAGIPTSVDPVGRIYPRSQSAIQARDSLFTACVRAGVRFSFNHRVERLWPPVNAQAPWKVDGISCPFVLLATGGQSAPPLGSDGSGLALAKSLGYSITPPVPALTSLSVVETWPARHSGVSLPDVVLTIAGLRGNESSERGELLFTHRGISGPVVLNLSARVARRLLEEKEVTLHLNFIRDLPDFRRLRRDAGTQSVHAGLARELPRTLAGTLLGLAEVPLDQTFSRLTAEQENRLCRCLTALPLTVRSTGGFKESMATSGGVSLKQVRSDTLEGRLTPRLYFAGEILDLDGPTGGWNLHWAFCSGHLAGSAIPRV